METVSPDADGPKSPVSCLVFTLLWTVTWTVVAQSESYINLEQPQRQLAVTGTNYQQTAI